MHIMKNTWKLFLPGLSAACLLYLCSCGDEPEKNQTAEKTEKAAEAPAPKEKQAPAKTTFEDSEEGSLTVRFKNTDASSAPPKVQAQRDNLSVLAPDDPAAAGSPAFLQRAAYRRADVFSGKTPDPKFPSRDRGQADPGDHILNLFHAVESPDRKTIFPVISGRGVP